MQPGLMTRVRQNPARWLLLLAAGIVAVLLAAHWYADRSAQYRALRDLPGAERRALYDRTMENLRTICAREGGDSLADFCDQQARVATSLPECSAECRNLASNYRRGATR